ncbi:MAG: LysR family transcriptional regulator [Hyphomicrobiaceae bacterium]|nr:LysR family transcriptional regulator [Hyphomicrobiaceae bacterium]
MNLIDPELLRTFVTFAETGSLARTARVVGRSPSAVTAQMQRLEDVVGQRLLQPEGRRRRLTLAGEEFVVHARHVLDAHRDAWLSLAGARAHGQIYIGVTQDFADSALPGLLERFGRTHPRVRMDLRVGRSAELATSFEDGALDILIAVRDSPHPMGIAVLGEPMIWVGSARGTQWIGHQVPLALLDAPCAFRSAALAALEGGGRPYRIAATSGSLSGLRAAVAAGLAITARTPRWLGEGLADVGRTYGLPPLPEVKFTLALRRKAETPATDLAMWLKSGLAAQTLSGDAREGRIVSE